ncbi:MAG TPA: VanZ family protein [Pilimelia sp.]|nr:VanZ family protein [Pilimelia sp.]
MGAGGRGRAPIRWPWGPARVAASAAAAAVGVEALQYLLDLGRVSSVDDVTLNALGAGLAALAARPWWRRRRAAGTAGGVG